MSDILVLAAFLSFAVFLLARQQKYAAIAVSNTWFAHFPDPRGPAATGDANFFWAHNVFAEGFAIVFLLVLLWGLCRIIPGLADFARALPGVYYGRLRVLVVGIAGR
jgi:exosortase/archaeosortase